MKILNIFYAILLMPLQVFCMETNQTMTPTQTSSIKRIPFGKPSKYSCGAKIKSGGFSIASTLENEIQCMLAGYKKIFHNTSSTKPEEILSIVNRIKQEEFPNSDVIIKHIIYEQNIPPAFAHIIKDKDIILFTPDREQETNLLINFRNNPLFESNNDEGINDYLVGRLLGYDEEDIEYYYHIDDQLEKYLEEDKANAEKILKDHGLLEFADIDNQNDLLSSLEKLSNNLEKLKNSLTTA